MKYSLLGSQIIDGKRVARALRNCALVGLVLAAAGGMQSCKSSKVIKGEVSERVGIEHLTVKPGGTTQQMIVEEARTWLGTPYKYAKAEKGEGTDCSGMVMKVYEQAAGCKIPRNSAKQAEYCRKVKETEVDTGDLVFFATGSDPEKVSHVGIVVDSDSFIHASSSKGVVISKISNAYFAQRLLMFGRVPGLEPALVTDR